MTYQELKQILMEYNWDDGFEVPQKILNDLNCDLALVLELFYQGDGYAYFEKISQGLPADERQTEWYSFISRLYEEILREKYPQTEQHFEIPLSKVQRYKLRKSKIPEVFLTDI